VLLSLLLGALAAPVVGSMLLWAACGLYALAAFSDWADGALARALNAQSAFGRAIDPIGDKLLSNAAILGLAPFAFGVEARLGVALAGAGGMCLLRDLWVAGLREALGARGALVTVSRLGKIKTALLLAALGACLFGLAAKILLVAWAGVVGLVLAAGLSLWSGADYSRQAFRLLTDEAKR